MPEISQNRPKVVLNRVLQIGLLLLAASSLNLFARSWDGPETPAPAGTWANSATVRIGSGLVKGFADKGPVWCWKGIPYAAPPVGALRWKAPEDPVSWNGIRDARKFAAAAPQILPVLGPKGSEDCLYLNIWRPKDGSAGLPVYVFIHGGGNSIGSGTSRDYHGNAVAGKSRMVYVTVNFRLGVLGWFRHPAVNGNGSTLSRSGNFGTLDLIKALEWVHNNIEAFGGDPGNVTIAGESGGAMDVLSLLTSPPAKGLFHRAIVESGLAVMRSTKDAETQSARLLTNLLVAGGMAKSEAEAEMIAAKMPAAGIDSFLRSKTPVELMKCIPTIVGGMADWPVIYGDGAVLPAEGYSVFASGNWSNQVPLLIGVNRDEMKLFRFLLKDPAPGTPAYQMYSRYQSLLWRAKGLDTIALAMSSNRGTPPVYAYRFDWGSVDESGASVLPGDRGAILGAGHYAEIPFFLGGRGNQLSVITGNTYTRANRPGRQKLTRVCMSYLANFARYGDPNGKGLARWEPWNSTPGADKLIILDAGLRDLRISYNHEVVTTDSILRLARSELKEPALGEVLRSLTGTSMFRIRK